MERLENIAEITFVENSIIFYYNNVYHQYIIKIADYISLIEILKLYIINIKQFKVYQY